MQELADYAGSQCLDGLTLTFVQVAQTSGQTVQLALLDVLAATTQAGHQRGDRTGGRLVDVTIQFGIHDGLNRCDLPLAFPDSRIGEGP